MTREPSPRVVLAPDKFKGSASAPEVADALATGVVRAVPAARIHRVPVADGGDGTVDAFVTAGWRRVELVAPGPTGAATPTSYAVRGDTAVVELAAVVGAAKLPAGRFDPLGAGSDGLGAVLAHALESGVRHLVLGLGGSASSDGGAGLLRGLGARILDARGSEVPPGGAALADAARLDAGGLHPLLRRSRLTLACDVDNPLLGPAGAVAVYGPQKGAGPAELAILEAALANWARVVGEAFPVERYGNAAVRPGAGAAGGTGFGVLGALAVLMPVTVRSGIDVVLELLGFADLVNGAALVVTGEGSFDEQSLRGKAPLGVLAAATAAGVPCVVTPGRSLLTPEQVQEAGFAGCHPLTDLESDPARCIAQARPLLVRVGERIAEHYLRARV
ncbi:glycerate kinase [Nocardia harenae]|uniref:glycerate kinase n=1 Tax=Nocardia harenae TaxID=358707 RepID=UPI0008337AB0|nr:glycerate kinase [Nocardia harenae]